MKIRFAHPAHGASACEATDKASGSALRAFDL